MDWPQLSLMMGVATLLVGCDKRPFDSFAPSTRKGVDAAPLSFAEVDIDGRTGRADGFRRDRRSSTDGVLTSIDSTDATGRSDSGPDSGGPDGGAAVDGSAAERSLCRVLGACGETYSTLEAATAQDCSAVCRARSEPDRDCFWGALKTFSGSPPQNADCCPSTCFTVKYGRVPHGYHHRTHLPGSHNDDLEYRCNNGSVSCTRNRN